MSKRKNEQGFTLVELSIVLVIIGLIVGGVLAGQALIKGAKIQAEINRFEQLDTAINTFSLRYGGLPGDITTVGAFAYTGAAAGNADGFIGAAADTDFVGAVDSEEANANAQLAVTGLVPGMPAAGFTTTIGTFASAAVGVGLIPSKLAGGIVFYGDGSHNWARYGALGDTVAGTMGLGAWQPASIALAIDSKLDDGNPFTGIVQTRTAAGAGTAYAGVHPPVAGTDCSDTAAGGAGYAPDNAAATPVCQIAIRLSQ